jgi:hypothetical protein
MTRGYFIAWLALIAAVVLAVVVANAVRGGRHPLLVDAASRSSCFVAHPCSRMDCTRRIA